LAIGLVVDDAIIVVEAVEHRIDQGFEPRDATRKAMEQVSGPVIAIAFLLAAVFVATAAIPGITGRLYQQFPVTIAISVVISAFNALTLSPALAGLSLKRKADRKDSYLNACSGVSIVAPSAFPTDMCHCHQFFYISLRQPYCYS
jgi:HAE1 family hydrophobic/amphiphilic exporter-1